MYEGGVSLKETNIPTNEESKMNIMCIGIFIRSKVKIKTPLAGGFFITGFNSKKLDNLEAFIFSVNNCNSYAIIWTNSFATAVRGANCSEVISQDLRA